MPDTYTASHICKVRKGKWMMSLPGLTDYDIIQNQPQWCQHFYIIIYNIFYILLCGLQFSKKEKENKFSHLRCTYHQLCSTKGQKQENQLRPAAAGLICCRRFTTSTNGSFEAGRKDSSGGKVGRGFKLQSFLAKLCNIVQGGGGGGERGGGEEGAGPYKSNEGPESSESSSGASRASEPKPKPSEG